MKQQQKKAQKAKKGLVTTTIVSTVLTVAMIAGIGAFVGLNFNTVKAIANGEKLFSQTQLDAQKNNGAVVVDPELAKIEAKYLEQSIKVGDFVDGFYYNVSAAPDFEQLDWDKAHITMNKETHPENFQDEPFVEQRIMFLISSFNPPKTMEEMQSESFYDKNDFGGRRPMLMLQVWKITLLDGSSAYMLCQHGSHAIYCSPAMSEIIRRSDEYAGWWYEGNVKDNLESSGETVVYVNDQQRIWGNWVSINPIEQVPNPVYPYSK